MASKLFNRLRRGKSAPRADSSSKDNNEQVGSEGDSGKSMNKQKSKDAVLRDIMDLAQGAASESNSIPDALNYARRIYTNSCWPSDLPWVSHQHNSSTLLQMDLLTIAAQSCLELQSDPELGRKVDVKVRGAAKEWDFSMKFTIDDVGEEDSRVLVVALQASRTRVDWLVTHEFKIVPTATLTDIDELGVHEGVLEATRAVLRPIVDTLREHLTKHPVQHQTKKPRLLLCGYSTGWAFCLYRGNMLTLPGGAVASLAWRTLVSMIQLINDGSWKRPEDSNSSKESIMVHFESAHCRTFGAPPVFSTSLYSVEPSPGQSPSTIIALVNEGDPVPRLDIPYLRNLIYFAAKMTEFIGPSLPILPISGWLHGLPSRQLFNAASMVGFRLLQEWPNQSFDDVCAVIVEEPIIERTLPIDFAQHSMERYYRNVQSWLLQDAHKLSSRKIRLSLYKEMRGTSGVGIGEALRVVGFEPWFYAGDLGSFREWRVSAMKSDRWDIQAIGFDYPYLHQMVHLIESRLITIDKTMYVCPFNGYECDESCKTCTLFQSRSAASRLVSGEEFPLGTAEDFGVMERRGCQLSGFIARVLRAQVRIIPQFGIRSNIFSMQRFHPKTRIMTKIRSQSGLLSMLTFEAREDPVAYRADDTLLVEVLGLHRTMSIELGLYAGSDSESLMFPILIHNLDLALTAIYIGERQGLSIQVPCQADVASGANFETFQRWLEDCEAHEKCLSIVPKPVPLPTRVIDVTPGLIPGLVRLHESRGEVGDYVALSYVWGGDQIKTKVDSLKEFKRAIRLDSLPKTIQDAITVTQKLGIRYLWVDSLCIIQDCNNDMHQEIANMAQTYKFATLTVSAAAATSCHQGFLHSRQGISRRLGLSFPIKLARLDDADDSHSQRGSTSAATQCHNIFACPDVSVGHELMPLADEPIESRAWTMQEAWLSPRILMFVSGSPRWVCHTTKQEVGGWKDRDIFYYPGFQGRERILAKGTQSSLYPGINRAIAQELRPFGLGDEYQTLLQTLDDASFFHRTTETVATESLEDKLDQWQNLVARYTSRRLTMPRDKLPAISAIASEFHRWLATNYLAGLWECNLVRDLLWYQKPSAGDQKSKRPPGYRAPSWSWAYVDGEIEFDGFSIDYATRTRAVIRECQTTVLVKSNPFGQVTGGVLILTAPLRRMSRQAVFDRFVITVSGQGVYFSDYIVPDALSDNPDFQDLPEDNETKHGLFSGKPSRFEAEGTQPSYDNYDESESKSISPGQTVLQPGLPNLLLQINGVTYQALTDEFWFLELARGDGPRGLVLVRNKNGTFGRTGYFRLGRTQHCGSVALDEMNVAGPRHWEWVEGLEMKTVMVE